MAQLTRLFDTVLGLPLPLLSHGERMVLIDAYTGGLPYPWRAISASLNLRVGDLMKQEKL